MRRARRPVGRRQELDPEDALRQLSVDAGQIIVEHHGETGRSRDRPARARCLPCRRDTIGYVSQFLRTVPRVSALDVVAEPLAARGEDREAARGRARELLARLNLPERLWSLPPATFSGGEQQRVNIARGFITDHPILLLDEPTASLDATNREVVIGLIAEKKAAGRGAARHLPRCRRARRGRRPRHRRDRIRCRPDRRMSTKKLSETPYVHETARGARYDARPLHRDIRALPRLGGRCSATIPT